MRKSARDHAAGHHKRAQHDQSAAVVVAAEHGLGQGDGDRSVNRQPRQQQPENEKDS
jgi:hypothetical protein